MNRKKTSCIAALVILSLIFCMALAAKKTPPSKKPATYWVVTLGDFEDVYDSDSIIYGWGGPYVPDDAGLISTRAEYVVNRKCPTCTGTYFELTVKAGDDPEYDPWIGFSKISMKESVTSTVAGPCNFPGGGWGDFPACMATFLNNYNEGIHPYYGYETARVTVTVYEVDFEDLELYESYEWDSSSGLRRPQISWWVHPGTDCSSPYSGVSTAWAWPITGLTMTRTGENTWELDVTRQTFNIGEFGWEEVPVRKRTKCQYYSYYRYDDPDTPGNEALETNPISFRMTFTRVAAP